jgi:adenylate cyclase
MWLKPRARLADFTNVSFVSVTDLGLRLVNATEIEARGSNEERQRLAQARELQAKLRGKIVIIAESGTGSMDVGNYAFETNVSNGLAHLLVLDNLLRGDTLREARKTEVAVLLAVICALISQAFVQLSPGRAGAVTLMLALLLVPLHAWSILSTGIFFPILAPEMIALTLFGINFSHSYTQANAQRQQVRQFFSKMVSPRVLEHLELNPELASLGGVRREATMFFSDVAGFTSISEKLTPTELAALLNRYLTPMTEIILEEDGYLDKYSGDGIMAVWGVPTEDKAHAIKACRAALRQHAKIQELAREILAESGIEIGVRMGINSGVVSAGNMGSESKFQYTVMGDAVNLAARLEPTNKDYGTYIILGNHTRELAGEAILARVLDLLVVKGKTEPVRIYELLGMRQSGDDTPDWARAYEEGFEKMLKRDWDGARAAFERCKQLRGSDEAAETMLARVADFRNNPPLEDWNGAYVRKKKD